MNLILQSLIVTALIAAMMLLRIFAFRSSLQRTPACDPESDTCSRSECFRGCSGTAGADETDTDCRT